MIKSFIPILTFFLIALVAFLAFNIFNLLNKDAIPQATQRQIEKVNPTLNTTLFDQLKAAQ